MSSLLDRMILRTQRALSPIEPLVTPTYADRSESYDGVTAASIAPSVLPSRNETQDVSTPGRSFVRQEPTEMHDPAPRAPVPSAQTQTQSTALPTDISPSTQPPAAQEEQGDGPRPASKQIQSTPNLVEAPPLPVTRAHIIQKVFQNTATQNAGAGVDPVNPQNPLQPTLPTEVSISIGHIEVRAVQRPQPVRKSAPPPRVTLDDYLHRRNEGAQ